MKGIETATMKIRFKCRNPACGKSLHAPKDEGPILVVMQFGRVSFYRFEFADIGDPEATTQ